MTSTRRKWRFSSAQTIMLGFAGVILLGALLLMLPVSSREGIVTPFLDCLFTATSAVCVTGLIVYDTATHWTLFGQTVILTLIQVGGMGVVTIAVAFARAAGRKLSLSQRSTLQNAISAPQLGGILPFTGFIVSGVLLVELLGAVLMAPVFIRDHGFPLGLWMGVFHSVSAFCNAGFDILGQGAPFSSLTAYADNAVINLTIMGLIVVGGLGFLTWADVKQHRWRVRRYRMQSKVILTTTALLILLPAAYFFLFEFEELPLKPRLLGSLFQSVTPRTAGFNTLDQTTLSETGVMLTSLLMIVGGAPGSTAGGMKTTTLAVLIACAAAIFRRRENGRFFGRRIDDDTVKNAATVFLLYISLFLLGGMAISRIEDLPLHTCLYESASAVGTVGLTLGITPALSVPSKLILIMQMFLGRVGALTLIFAVLPAQRNTRSQLPLDKITVG